MAYSPKNSQLAQLTAESWDQGHSWHLTLIPFSISNTLMVIKFVKYVSTGTTTNGFPGLTIYDFIGAFHDGCMFLEESWSLRFTIVSL